MSIDEEIEKHRRIAETKKTLYDACILKEYNRHLLREYKEHEQLAELLEELKDYRDKNKMVVRVDVENMDSVKDKIDELSKYAEIQYNKAIDDFAILIKETLNHDWATTKISEQIIYNRLFDKCNEIAEQLRKCKVDESTD